jgi:hypothetical protein
MSEMFTERNIQEYFQFLGGFNSLPEQNRNYATGCGAGVAQLV